MKKPLHRLIWAAISLLLAASSCTSERISRTIKDTWTYINERPDSALSILENIPSERIRSNRMKAQFALLYSIALDKNYIDTDNDSLARVAVSYYRTHGKPEYKMKAWYYLGRVQQNRGDDISAIVSFTNAEKHAQKAGDQFYLGMIYRGMAEVYKESYNEVEGLKFSELSYKSFCSAGYERHKNFALLDVAIEYNNLRKFDECIEICMKLKGIAENAKDTVLLAESLRIYASAVLWKENTEPMKAIEALEFVRDSLKYNLIPIDYQNLANSYHLTGQNDIASAIIESIEDSYLNERDIAAAISLMKYKIEKSEGNYQEALENLRLTTFKQDTIFMELLNQSAASAQRDWYKEQADNDEYRIKTNNTIFALTLSFSILIILIIIYLFIHEIKKKEREIQKHMEQAAAALEDMNITKNLINEFNNHALAEFREQINSLYETKFRFIDQICQEYYSFSGTPSLQRNIFKLVKQLISNLSEDKEYPALELIVNKFKRGIMELIRLEMPKLKEEEYRILCYCYAGFTATTITLLLKEENVNIIYNKKSRIKKKIEKSDSEHKNFFLRELK